MKKNLKICLIPFLILALLVSIAGCGSKEAGETSQSEDAMPVGEEGSLALYLYICGSDLETRQGAATKNLKELLESDLPENVQIVIETGGALKWRKYNIDSDSISRYTIKNGELTLLEKCPQASMGSGDTFADFLTYSVKNFPAEKMGVLLWDHGGGSLKGVCFDENYEMDSLSLDELDNALSTVRGKMADDFEFIGFDACLMANYETASVIKKYAKNMVASEELEPSGGWDYTALASFGTDEFYSTVLSDYAKKCKSKEKETYTLSHIDLEKFAAVSDKFEEFANTLNESAKDGLGTVIQAASDCMNFGTNTSTEGYSNMIDLSWFAENMQNSELKDAIDNAVNSVNGSQKKGASGVSLYYPLSNAEDVEQYINISKSDTYKAFLEEKYLDTQTGETLIEYTDKGSDDNGELHIELTPESVKNVSRVLYYAYMFIDGEKKDELLTISLGIDNEVKKTSSTGYTTVFAGEWIKWHGEFLQIEATDSVGSLTTFSSPAIVDTVEGNIRFAYDEKTKKCVVQGFLPTTENGSVARVEEIKNGAKITIRHHMYNDDMQTVWYDGTTFSYKKGKDMKLAPLKDGAYTTMFAVVDLYGNGYLSNPAVIQKMNGKNTIFSIPESSETEE